MINPLNKNDMYIPETLMSIETLIERTNGMTPIEFENFADDNGIEVEWLDVTLSNYNDGFYNAILPQYEYVSVFASDGSSIEIQ
jgi:DNA-binding phage protein